MLIFLPRGGPFCSPLKLETLESCGARAAADSVRLWEGFTFPRGMRSKGSKCWSDARFLTLRRRKRVWIAERQETTADWTSCQETGEGRVCRGRSETCTYQCEALPDFSSVAFKKTLCRLLDILEGWEGPAHPGQWAVWGRETTRECWAGVAPEQLWGGFDAETRATASSREGVSPELRREAAQLPETGRTGRDSPRGPGPWLWENPPESPPLRPYDTATEPPGVGAGGVALMAPPPSVLFLVKTRPPKPPAGAKYC